MASNDDGIITALQGDIDTPTDGFADNVRLYLPPTAFNRFAVTREINDGLLAPRFAPSQRAWVLSGVQVPVNPPVMRRPDATPTIAEGINREEAAGRVASSLFAIIYYSFLGGSGLANRITETALLWEDHQNPDR